MAYARILVALDGSECSEAAGALALSLARHVDAEIIAFHAYGAQLHNTRFAEMTPHLPAKYLEPDRLEHLTGSHDSLILEGFRALSRGYMDTYTAQARADGIRVREMSREGKNYAKILEVAAESGADLIVLGAWGVGADEERSLGSTAARVVRGAPCDVLVARPGAPGKGAPVLVGIDGSDGALAAVNAACLFAAVLDAQVHLASVYDPALHKTVFRTMAQSLSEERQEEVGLADQETLHDELIDDSMAKLYDTFLADGVKRAQARGYDAPTGLVEGKVPHGLEQCAEQKGAQLIAVGRYGQHRVSPSDIGSNAEGTVRRAKVSVLVCGSKTAAEADSAPPPHAAGADNSGPAPAEGAEMQWEAGALEGLGRVPSFVRAMAKRAVENAIRETGGTVVTAKDFNDIAAKFGMGGKPSR